MYFSIPMPANHPIKGINDWKNAKKKEIVKILFTFKFLIVNPFVTDTANESIDKPTAININVIMSILFFKYCLTVGGMVSAAGH